MTRRTDRSAWWFARMRQAVDGAFDWTSQPPAPAKPEKPDPSQLEFPEQDKDSAEQRLDNKKENQ